MAHFSGDAGLALIFADDAGADPFALLAAQWLRVAPDAVTPQQRNHAKQLAYGLLYGMGAGKLGDELGCATLAEAKEVQARGGGWRCGEAVGAHEPRDAWLRSGRRCG